MLYAANSFQAGASGAETFQALGPLPSPSNLIEVTMSLQSATAQIHTVGIVLTGSDSETIDNFDAGASLIDRGITVEGLRPPQWVSVGPGSIVTFLRLPLHVLLTSGPLFVLTRISGNANRDYTSLWTALLQLQSPLSLRTVQTAEEPPQ